ncbi:Calx-beta domain-containing protein [Catellatospora sichuanensis]|uniref:Calx-beta domain-containing protein n=1 Tax=Catellatospora sichuanensis TaxID=1969805 RepID=UPI00118429EB|nr:Calx-beta domain-containing protein [Catellatospora sichuanensis]
MLHLHRRKATHRWGVRVLTAAALAASALLSQPTPPASAAAPGVEPSAVTRTLPPGGSATIAKVVHTPAVPPNPDIVLLADTTGSMGGAIANVKTNASDILTAVSGAQPSAQFAAANYRDAGDAVPFAVDQALTADQALVQAGVNAWAAGGGGDFPEDGLNALYQLATGAVTFRPDGTRIVVIFGDAPSHEPSNGHTRAQVIAALQAADIRVVAVNVGAGGLNQNGQIQAVTDATGGVFLDNVPSNQVADAILAGIQAIEVTVTPSVDCDDALSLSLSPASRTVTSGDDAAFSETVEVDGEAAGGALQCEVDFLVDGTSRGYVQTLTVHVPGLSAYDVQVNEGAGTADFTVTLSVPAPFPVSVSYATATGTAGAADFTAKSGLLTFSPNETLKTVTVPITDDTADELNETFKLSLSSPSGAALTDPSGEATIVDNDRDGVFTCTATALNLAGQRSARANPANSPCVDSTATGPDNTLNAGLVTVQTTGLSASTDLTPNSQSSTPAVGDKAVSTAAAGSTKITVAGLVTIEIGYIDSTASATCVAGPGGLVPQFAGSSTISSLKVNGATVTVGSGPLTIPLVVGSLKLNSTTTTATGVTQQALILDTLLTDLIIGETKAGITGTPTHPTGTPCRA